MKPRLMPNLSSRTLAVVARQFVVQDALEMIRCLAGSYAFSLTPSTTVSSGSLAGAVMMTFLAPAKDPDVTVVLGVNEKAYDPAKHRIISNASCTTNCLATTAKVLDDKFGIKRRFMTTVHCYTNDQPIHDFPHKDLRRARAGAVSMIPTTTGAATAVGLVLPKLKGKLDGIAIRVPTANVSVVDLVAELDKPATPQTVNDAFREAAAGSLRGILDATDEELVSSDFNGNPHSSIVDLPSTAFVDGNLIKVLAWYDNW